MKTMKTTTKKKTARIEPMTITLAQFVAQMDEYLDEATGVEDAVRAYRSASDIASVTDSQGEARALINAKIDRYIEIGHDRWNGLRIVRRQVGGGKRVVLRADVVKQAMPALWEDSRLPQTSVNVKHQGLDTGPRHALAAMNTSRDAWAALEAIKARNAAAKKEAEAAREVLLGVFDRVTEVWDGSARLTADGWTVGWNVSQRFNVRWCRELADEREIDLSPLQSIETVAGRRQYALELIDADDGEGFEGD